MTHNFQSVGKKTLKMLQGRFGFDLWMITRTDKGDWIVLSSDDQDYDGRKGTMLEWQESICSKMIEDLGPHISPKIVNIPSYLQSLGDKKTDTGAYIGVPLNTEDGSLFGALCAINPAPNTKEVAAIQPIVEMMASLLNAVLVAELRAQSALRRAELAEAEATRDALTGLFNRSGWTQQITKEENRCNRYGSTACVFNIDLDDLKLVNDTQGHAAGDAMIIKAANALLKAARTSDVVARLGGDEFCVLGIECDAKAAKTIEKRIRKCLAAAGVEASIGLAMRSPDLGLPMACAEADEKMYIEKHSKKHSKKHAGSLAMAA